MDPIIQIGEKAPLFQLTDIHGKSYSLENRRGWIIILNFWSAECPWSERADQELIVNMKLWNNKVQAWWIASNANESSDLVARVAAERKLPIVLSDTHHRVADLYGAQTTPHFFIIDRQGKLAYQGAWDDITFRQRVATQTYVPKVIEALKNNLAPEITQTNPYGCALVKFLAEDG